MSVPSWVARLELGLRASWVVVGVGVAVAMGRRGHDAQLWGLIGLVLGPLAVPAAIVATRRAARRPPIAVFDGRPGPGQRDIAVPVAADGLSSSLVALGEQRDSIRRMVLVATIGPDRLDTAAHRDEVVQAKAILARSAKAVQEAGLRPEGVIVEGRLVVAVAAFATAEGLEVLAQLDDRPRTRRARTRRARPPAAARGSAP